MATTRQNLDIQSDKVLTEPTVQTRMVMQDTGATQSLFIDWDEPAGTSRTVNFTDPGSDDTVAYLNATQVFTNKQITTLPSNPDDITNKSYVDTAISTSTPTATSGSGGDVEGILTMDEDKGLLINSGVAEIKIDGSTVQFNGSGQLEANAPIADATAGSGGGTKGILTADTDKGLNIISGVAEVKVDSTTIGFNTSGEIEVISGGGPSGATGTVSTDVDFTEDISGVSPPTTSTTGGGDVSTLDFPAGGVTGTRFAFSVPEDYFTGNLTISAIQQMSFSDPAGSIEISTQAKIVDVSAGSVDSATYPETQSTHTVPTNTDVEKRGILTITDGDFSSGDTIQILVKRLGNDVADTNSADWKVIGFTFSYTAIISGRVATVQTNIFNNPPSGIATTPGTIAGGDVSTEDFPAGSDTGLKFAFSVPENWDQISPADVRLNFAMSLNDPSGVVRLEPRAKIARATTGAIDTIAPTDFDFTPGTGDSTVPKQTTIVLSIPAASLDPGDSVTIVLFRRATEGADTHTGDFQLIYALTTMGAVNATGVNAVTIREEYVNQGIFGNVSGGGINADTDFIDLTDFETYDKMSATTGSGSIDVSYQGRVTALTTQIKRISLFVKGTTTATYELEVHAEGTGLVHSTGPTSLPASITEITRTDLDLSAQPDILTGSGRFAIIVKIVFSSAPEDAFVSRPFVRLE